MKIIIGLAVAMGFFFGLVFFILVAIIDGFALALPTGLLSGLLSGLLLAVYMTIHSAITNRKHQKYKKDTIPGSVIFGTSLFRLNGNKKDAGHLFLTDQFLIAVMIRRKKVLSEIKIPLSSIISISQRHDYGHLANTLIVQEDGMETRFISDHYKLVCNLRPLVGDAVFAPMPTYSPATAQELELLDQRHAHLQNYISQLEAPSKVFRTFLSDYFTGHPMIRGRGEEDATVWIQLTGKEREIAVQMILDHMGHDSAYIRAAGCFRDERAIPMLKNMVDTLPERYSYERLLAARTLYDWFGYERYLDVLGKTLPNGGEYTKVNLMFWIDGLDKETATYYIFLLLEDSNSFVRWCAYDALLNYFHLGTQDYQDTKFYTADSVYTNQPLFRKRLCALRKKIEAL